MAPPAQHSAWTGITERRPAPTGPAPPDRSPPDQYVHHRQNWLDSTGTLTDPAGAVLRTASDAGLPSRRSGSAAQWLYGSTFAHYPSGLLDQRQAIAKRLAGARFRFEGGVGAVEPTSPATAAPCNHAPLSLVSGWQLW